METRKPSEAAGSEGQKAGGTSGRAGGAAGGSKAKTGATGAGGAKKKAGTTTGAGGAKKKTGATAGGTKKKAGTTTGGGGAKTKGRGGTAAGGRAAAGKAGARAGTAGGSAKLRKDLREFVEAHPGGWGHNEWIGLVNLLRDRGHDTSDTDAVGMALERERLRLVLERVPGLGAQRVSAIANKYPRVWNLMEANAEEIATVANIPQAVAAKVKEALR